MGSQAGVENVLRFTSSQFLQKVDLSRLEKELDNIPEDAVTKDQVLKLYSTWLYETLYTLDHSEQRVYSQQIRRWCHSISARGFNEEAVVQGFKQFADVRVKSDPLAARRLSMAILEVQKQFASDSDMEKNGAPSQQQEAIAVDSSESGSDVVFMSRCDPKKMSEHGNRTTEDTDPRVSGANEVPLAPKVKQMVGIEKNGDHVSVRTLSLAESTNKSELRPPPSSPSGGPSRPSRRVCPGRSYICKRCNLRGHYLHSCPTNLNPAFDRPPPADYRCRICGARAKHLAAVCPQNKTYSSLTQQRIRKGIIKPGRQPAPSREDRSVPSSPRRKAERNRRGDGGKDRDPGVRAEARPDRGPDSYRPSYQRSRTRSRSPDYGPRSPDPWRYCCSRSSSPSGSVNDLLRRGRDRRKADDGWDRLRHDDDFDCAGEPGSLFVHESRCRRRMYRERSESRGGGGGGRLPQSPIGTLETEHTRPEEKRSPGGNIPEWALYFASPGGEGFRSSSPPFAHDDDGEDGVGKPIDWDTLERLGYTRNWMLDAAQFLDALERELVAHLGPPALMRVTLPVRRAADTVTHRQEEEYAAAAAVGPDGSCWQGSPSSVMGKSRPLAGDCSLELKRITGGRLSTWVGHLKRSTAGDLWDRSKKKDGAVSGEGFIAMAVANAGDGGADVGVGGADVDLVDDGGDGRFPSVIMID